MLDGELLVLREGRVAPFGDLQQRLNRKTVDAKTHGRPSRCHILRAYDILSDAGEDLRAGRPGRSVAHGWRRWSASHTGGGRLDLSPLDPLRQLGGAWPPSAPSRRKATPRMAEGAHAQAAGQRCTRAAGPRGRGSSGSATPILVDAVMMYAQRGHGRRSSFYSDYTFGVWSDEATDA